MHLDTKTQNLITDFVILLNYLKFEIISDDDFCSLSIFLELPHVENVLEVIFSLFRRAFVRKQIGQA